MEKNISHSVYAFILGVLVLFPFTVQATHALQNHEHKFCTAKDVKHIHKQNIDCSIYHLQVHQYAIDFSVSFSLYSPLALVYDNSFYKLSNYTTELNLKSSRAPPCFIE